MRRIRTIKHPRGYLLMELVPQAYHDGLDFVNQICDNALDLECGAPADGINLGKAMQKLEKIICGYATDLWHKTAYG